MEPPQHPRWLLAAAGGVLLTVVAVVAGGDATDAPDVVSAALMAVSGCVLLAVAAWSPASAASTRLVGLLGASVLVYPSLLTAGATGAGGPVGETLGLAWHVVPLTLVQLLPVVASSAVVGRTHRRWETTVLAVAAAGLVVTALALARAPGVDVLTVVSLVLWFGSFALAPVATWTAVRGTSGETRGRAVLAGLASLLPVVVIAWCAALGVLGRGLGWSDDQALVALFAGFSLGTAGCGVLAAAAVGPADTALGARTVTATLHVLVGLLVLIVSSVAVLLASAADVGPAWAAVCGVAATLAVGIPWRRAHTWLSRAVDPRAELEHELEALRDVAEGRQRDVALHVVRRLVDDPGLTLAFRVADEGWVDGDDGPDAPPQDAVALALRADGSSSVLAAPTHPPSRRRLERFGDCAGPLGPAVLEARLAHETRSAQVAARGERERLSRNLHDGLQGRILGLALRLRLSGRGVDDPTARLALESTIDALRDLVEDVRALAGGRLPEQLVEQGLAPALHELFAPVRGLVDLDVPSTRFAAPVEATAYFVVGEAVTNALKHADPERVAVHVGTTDDGRLLVSVQDDGRGGADPRLGSGLRGLSERVSAAGGVLVVRDGSSGTVVEAVLPCGS